MRDSIAAAHRTLDALFDQTRSAIRTRAGGAAAEAFGRLREALETHFDQEDRLYYPTIAALRPQTRETVRGFADAHEKFRSQFQEISAFLEDGAMEEAERRFESFAQGFSHHEGSEEQLLSELDREVSAAS